eukprot:gnl/MRDRNA2_/MRDRNA2_138513_c0_seq1.p1 gnl/MRDRNA2_/MRDRNA2_138513_c0~~gnl/MRDRNA2_/MRDRNA2_138513_c0_seq1.p1  ORF type:complete len:282 (+),score=68.61 gnl/MRDRNA2_/MRDRNA2_138513_c0_seq1:80-925(+)
MPTSSGIPDDYYELLGLSREANSDSIRRAYRREALTWHPDKCKESSRKQEFEARFKAIAEAYEVLSDPQKKQTYDHFGKEALQGQPSGGFEGFHGFASNSPFVHVFRPGGGTDFEFFEPMGGGSFDGTRRARFMDPFQMFNFAFGGQNPFDQMRHMHAQNPEMTEEEQIRRAVEASLEEKRQEMQPRDMSEQEALQKALKASMKGSDMQKGLDEDQAFEEALKNSLKETTRIKINPGMNFKLSAWKPYGNGIEPSVSGLLAFAFVFVLLRLHKVFRFQQPR